MIKRVCDKCGRVGSATMPLFRFEVVPAVPLNEEDCGARSKLDLCESCKNKILQEANEPEPQQAEGK